MFDLQEREGPSARGEMRQPLQIGAVVLRLMRHFGLLVMLGVVMLCVLLGGSRNVEKLGDNLQIALPLTGLACAAAEGRGVQYFGRFLLLEIGIHGPKNLLGDHPLNMRPSGGDRGFPSGHTSAAAFGATGLVQGCLKSNKAAQAATVIAAGFVGASRIEHGAHTAIQVVAGAVLGFVLQVAALVAFDRAMGRIWLGMQAAVTWGLRMVSYGVFYGAHWLRGTVSERIGTAARAERVAQGAHVKLALGVVGLVLMLMLVMYTVRAAHVDLHPPLPQPIDHQSHLIRATDGKALDVT